MAQKPSIPKGTRDFLPDEVAKRNYIFDTIKASFRKYGFEPIETPSFELTSTLLGKYGEEGDQLMFKIFPRGNKLRPLLNATETTIDIISKELNIDYNTNKISDKALDKLTNVFVNRMAEEVLRYDLTVPFARFVVQHQNDLSFPFKRYQIQPVWRADRPQKGRYREFYQCDADVVGSDSLIYEVDFILLFDEVLSNLGLKDFTIKINNRKILAGISEVLNASDKIIDITVSLDKIDKIGVVGVKNELTKSGFSDSFIKKLEPLFDLRGSTKRKLKVITEYLANSNIGLEGVKELLKVIKMVQNLGLKNAKLEFDVTLARGLNYYTGAIFEVKANGVKMGSICGGGRYDDLTGVFGMKDMSGVGISFGADRIYDVLNELNLFPKNVDASLDVLFINFGEKEQDACLKFIKDLRANNISSEIYPSPVKVQKQMKYANDRGVKYIALVGEQELEQGVIELKNMQSGEQQTMSLEEIITHLTH